MLSYFSCLLVWFFFHAEYGIRDTSVTGVQTFFFSSRRRHTRYIGDWSSDVCSSDLECAEQRKRDHHADDQRAGDAAEEKPGDRHHQDKAVQRSEERRVGKECRSRWSPDH